MNRFPHFLPHNKASQIPSNCIWFDTETKPTIDPDGKEHHHLWFGYACYQRRESETTWEAEQWLRFESIAPFWEWVISRARAKTRLYLFSHNGGFDLPVMDAFKVLPEKGFRLSSAVADAPPLILTWQKGGATDPEFMLRQWFSTEKLQPDPLYTIRFIDTLNIWRLPLDSVGKSIGLAKLPMPPFDAPSDVWDTYGKRDVEVIQEVCKRWFTFIRDNDLGGFAPTLASQAFNSYRHRFMNHAIFIDSNERAIELSRDSYLGGRTEAFKIGHYHGEFYYIDVNSMYPSVMVKEQFPNRLISVYGRPTKDELDYWLENRCVIADCDIETDEPAYPIVHDGKLMFPTGHFRVQLATPEFRYAWEHGHIARTHRVAVYECAPIFESFIAEIYKLRLAATASGDTVNAWLYKILMNSLYGKFAQRGRVYETVGETPTDEIWSESVIDMDTGERWRERSFGGILQRQLKNGESRESFPAIASHVTSHARLVLWHAMKQAGRENVFYCDTDSMVVNRDGFTRMSDDIDRSELGKWSLERTLSSVQIYGAKDYVFDDLVATKGVRSNALWLEPNKIEQDRFMGLRSLMEAGDLSAPVVFRQQKTLKRYYDKGQVLASGDVIPWSFPLD